MKRIFISAILLFVIAAGSNAQSKTIKVHKNGSVIYEEFVTSVDSITFGISLKIPANVSAALSDGDTSITVTWLAVYGATHYEVYRSGDSITYALLDGNVVPTTYTDSLPLTGRNYYKIKARSATLASEFSKASDLITFCETITDSISLTVSSSYTWGSQTYTQSGVYQQTFMTENGCDSVVTLTLTVIPFNYNPEMVTVPGGTTTLNGTTVTIDTFSIGKYEMTQKIWEEVMGYSGVTSAGDTLSVTTAYLGSTPDSTYGVGDNYPVYYVSYGDIVNIFLPRLNAITGKSYRLPTEAEWEYAAKGGQQTHNYTYSGSDTIDNVVWCSGNSGSIAHEVGTKLPNELGIYDMSGNVWEWCSDWDGSYPSSSNNPTGAATGSNRVMRGGSSYAYMSTCTVSYRYSMESHSRDNGIGFRVALVP